MDGLTMFLMFAGLLCICTSQFFLLRSSEQRYRFILEWMKSQEGINKTVFEHISGEPLKDKPAAPVEHYLDDY